MRLFILFLAAVCLFSCKKKASDSITPIPTPPPAIPSGKVTGKIVLPSGSPYSISSLNIISTVETVPVSNNGFTIDTSFHDFSTIMAVTASDDIVMMRYNYPKQPNYDISPQTTALAVVMNSPAVLALDNSSKLKLINDITVNPEFLNFVTEIEKSIKAGANYLQPDSGSSIMNAVNKLFTTVSGMRMTGAFEEPIKFERSGKTISFAANTACPYVIGVYKDNGTQRIEQLVLGGAQVYATSIKEMFQGLFGGGYGDIPQVIYTLPGDGQYEFKIRSGVPGFSTNRIEETEALRENIVKGILDITDGYLGIPINSECFKAIRTHARDWVKTVAGLPSNSNSLGTLSSIMHDLSVQFFESQNDLFKCTSIKDEGSIKKYVRFVGRVVKFFDLVSKIGTTMNSTAHLISWIKTKPAIDTCFKVTGSTITNCEFDSTAFYQAAVLGKWDLKNIEYPNDPPSNLELYAGGTGKYTGSGGQPFPNGGYNITWWITRNNGKYYFYESGFVHPAYNQYRVIGNNLPMENLTYPLSFFKTYINLGSGTVEALTYTKK